MSAQRSAQAAFKSMRVIKSVEEDDENLELGKFSLFHFSFLLNSSFCVDMSYFSVEEFYCKLL